MIEIHDLSYTFPRSEIPALDNIALTIPSGESVALMGANGSGKTSLLRSLIGLIRPTSGTVHIDELSTQNPEHLPEIRRRVGLVFQNPDDQIVSATVEREIAFGLENLCVPTQEMHTRVDDVLERFHLTRYRTHAPHLLSGGERQRLALASIVVMRPRYLLLDEPTALLDPGSRQTFLQSLHALHREGDLTPILVTQLPSEAAWADRVIVLHQGRIALDGPPADVFAQVNRLTEMGLQPPLSVQIAQRLNISAPLPLSLDDLAARMSKPAARRVIDAPPSREPSAAPIITARNLRHIYDAGLPSETAALDGLNIDLYSGEIAALIGPGGSGKSTFIQHLNGLLKPASGALSVCGIDATTSKKRTALCRKVGLIFQFPEAQLFAEIVFDDVAFGPKNLRLPDIKTRVHEALTAVGLDPERFASRNPLALSGGEKRRVAIAGVIAMQPDVLVLDEPTAGLDPAGAHRIETLIRAQKASGRTIVFITHDMDLAARLSDRVYAFQNGRIAIGGIPEEILNTRTLSPLGLLPPEIVQLTDLLRAQGWSIAPHTHTLDAWLKQIIIPPA